MRSNIYCNNLQIHLEERILLIDKLWQMNTYSLMKNHKMPNKEGITRKFLHLSYMNNKMLQFLLRFIICSSSILKRLNLLHTARPSHISTSCHYLLSTAGFGRVSLSQCRLMENVWKFLPISLCFESKYSLHLRSFDYLNEEWFYSLINRFILEVYLLQVIWMMIQKDKFNVYVVT